jgi:hypothetical protein
LSNTVLVISLYSAGIIFSTTVAGEIRTVFVYNRFLEPIAVLVVEASFART